MEYYSTFGYNDFVLCFGHKGEIIKGYFLDYDLRVNDLNLVFGENSKIKHNRPHDEVHCKVALAETGLNSMAGTRIGRIKDYIGETKILCSRMVTGSTMLTEVRPPGRFGELEFDSDKKVVGFNEKSQARGGRINGWFFVLNRKIFDYLSDDENLIFEQERQLCLIASILGKSVDFFSKIEPY